MDSHNCEDIFIRQTNLNMQKRKYGGEKRLVFTSAKTWADVLLPQATNLKMAVCVFLVLCLNGSVRILISYI